jgi:hypothetical protein
MTSATGDIVFVHSTMSSVFKRVALDVMNEIRYES